MESALRRVTAAPFVELICGDQLDEGYWRWVQ
jgi:hypothetical protein